MAKGSGLGGIFALLALALLFTKSGKAPRLNGNGTTNGTQYRTRDDPEQEESRGEESESIVTTSIIRKYITTPPVIIREFVPTIAPYTSTVKGVATVEQEIRNVVANALARADSGGGRTRELFT